MLAVSSNTQIGVFWRVGHFERKFKVYGDVARYSSMNR